MRDLDTRDGTGGCGESDCERSGCGKEVVVLDVRDSEGVNDLDTWDREGVDDLDVHDSEGVDDLAEDDCTEREFHISSLKPSSLEPSDRSESDIVPE